MNVSSSSPRRAVVQSRGMSASLRRLALRRRLSLLAVSALVSVGTQAALASSGTAGALTFNTARTTTFRALTGWTPRTSAANSHSLIVPAGFAAPNGMMNPMVGVTYTDSGTGTINMSAGFTAGGTSIPAGGTTTSDTLVFNSAAVSTQTDDLTQVLNANVLTFSNTAALTLLQGMGTTIGLGGMTPTINLNDSAALTGNPNNSTSANTNVMDGLVNAMTANTTVAGTGSATFTGGFTGAYSLTMNGTGTLILNVSGTGTGNNTYTGGTYINSGTLKYGSSTNNSVSNKLGTGTIYLGNTSGSANATLQQIYDSDSLTNNIVVQSGNTGTMQIVGDGNLNLTGTITLGTYSTGQGVTFGQVHTNSLNINGVIQDPSGLVGSGGMVTITGSTVSFNANNTYTGATVINSGGKLTLGSNGTTGSLSASSAITDNGTLGFNRTNAVTQGTDFASVISGSGGISKGGATSSVLTLNGANTYSGATSVTSGTLKAGVASVANTSGAFGNNSAVTLANTAGVTLDITGFNTSIGSLTGGGATGGNVTLGAATLTVGGDNTSPAAYAGTISGTGGGLTKSGTGTLTLSGTNTYTGATNVNAGSLTAGSTQAFGVNSAVTLANTAGATLNITGFNTQIGSLTGGGATGGNVTLGAATLTVGGDNTSPAAYAGTISGTGGGLTKNGSGTLTLSGANTYTGATTVSAGSLKAGSTNAFGSNSAVTLANVSGAALDITGFNTSIGSLTGGGATGGNVTLGAATLTVGGDNTSPAAYAGTVSGTGILAKVGTGTMTLGGNGTSTAGQVKVDNNGALTFGSATESPALTLSGSGLLINSNSNSNTPTFNMVAGTLGLGSSNGAFTENTGTYNQTGGAVTVSGSGISYLANGSSTYTSVFNLSGGSFTTGGYFYGAVRGTATMNLSGTGVLTAPAFSMLYGNSMVSNVANGTVNLGNGAAGGTLVVNAVNNNFNGASTGTSTFNFNGGTLKASGSSTTFMTGLTTANVRNGGAVVNTNGFSDTIGQALVHSTIGGDNDTDGGLTKQGVGTLTLAGTTANTYTGTTTVSAGTLALNKTAGVNAIAGSITVNGDGSGLTASATNGVLTLQASNQINDSSNLTLNAGTFSTGGFSEGAATTNSGTQGLGTLTLGTASSASSIDLGSGASKLVFAGSSGVSWASSSILDILNWTGTAGVGGGTDQLFFGSSTSGLSTSELMSVFFVNPSGLTAGSYQATQLSDGEVVPLNPAAAPEPSQWVSLLIGALGLSGLALRARRRSAMAAA